MHLSRPLGWMLAVLGLLAAALLVRCLGQDNAIRRDGILFTDIDTVRRLERIRAIDTADRYPVVETKDGFPHGSVSHWTRPMDAVLALLDAPARMFLPQARPREAGALIAGPVLALLSLLLALLGWRALAGPHTALLAGLVYALSYSVVNVSWLGNGDHQNLQHLCLVAAFVAGLLQLSGHKGAASGALAGACLGLAVWVSTESMLFLYPWLAAVLAASLVRAPEYAFWRGQLAWCAGLLAALLAGHLREHGAFGAFEIDKVSWFQLWQALVWTLFVALAALRRARTPAQLALTALAALGLGLLPLLAHDLRAEFAHQRAHFAQVNVWLQNEVSEFRNLFDDGLGGFSLAPALDRFSFLIVLLPALLWGTARCRAVAAPVRAALIVLGTGTFALACWEVKLGHLFALVWPLLIVLGARGLHAAHPVPTWLRLAFAALVATAALTSLPQAPLANPLIATNARYYREIAERVAARAGAAPQHSVLAAWDLGAHLMYYGDLPVVASGYHRNLDGILDGSRAMLSTPEDDAALRALLHARAVRWVVVWHSRAFLPLAARTLGLAPLTPERAAATLFWRLRNGAVDGFQEVERGPELEGGSWLYRIFEVSH